MIFYQAWGVMYMTRTYVVCSPHVPQRVQMPKYAGLRSQGLTDTGLRDLIPSYFTWSRWVQASMFKPWPQLLTESKYAVNLDPSVDSKKLEHGCSIVYAVFLFWFGV